MNDKRKEYVTVCGKQVLLSSCSLDEWTEMELHYPSVRHLPPKYWYLTLDYQFMRNVVREEQDDFFKSLDGVYDITATVRFKKWDVVLEGGRIWTQGCHWYMLLFKKGTYYVRGD